jgi:hypothetical protein
MAASVFFSLAARPVWILLDAVKWANCEDGTPPYPSVLAICILRLFMLLKILPFSFVEAKLSLRFDRGIFGSAAAQTTK